MSSNQHDQLLSLYTKTDDLLSICEMKCGLDPVTDTKLETFRTKLDTLKNDFYFMGDDETHAILEGLKILKLELNQFLDEATT